MTTCAPRVASMRAAARPIPLVAPVTSAVVPARSADVMVFASLLWFVGSQPLTGSCDPQCRVKTGLSNPITCYAPDVGKDGTGSADGPRLTRRGRETRERIVAAAA